MISAQCETDEKLLEIDVSIKAVRLNPIKLASDERYWIESMSDVLVDGNVVTTDTLLMPDTLLGFGHFLGGCLTGLLDGLRR